MENFPYFSIFNIKEFLESHEASVRKKWGQNFLIDPNIIEIIFQNIPESAVQLSELILEVGPGLGALTHRLPAFSKPVQLIEIDPVLAKNLQTQEYILRSNMQLIEGDVLDYIPNYNNKNLYIIGNLPYYISSEILTSILTHCTNLQGGIFMLQKEFANRIEKEISSLSIFASAFGKWEIVKIVKPNCFYPAPTATSAILRFSPFAKPLISHPNIPFLEKILKSMFWGKRKTISHILKYTPFLEEKEREEILQFLKTKIELDLNFRPEDIPKEIYYKIANSRDSL